MYHDHDAESKHKIGVSKLRFIVKETVFCLSQISKRTLELVGEPDERAGSVDVSLTAPIRARLLSTSSWSSKGLWLSPGERPGAFWL